MFIITTLVVSSVLATDITIQQAAPDTTIAFISAPNIGDVLDKLESAGICNQVCAAFSCDEGDALARMPFADICESLNLGIDKEDFTPPSGYAGAALYPVVDYETGTVGLGAIALVQLDEKVYGDLFNDILNRDYSEFDFESEIISLVGRDVLMLHYSVPEINLPVMNLNMEAFETSYAVFSDGYLIVGTEPDGMASALLALDGEVEPDMLETNDDYNELRSRCGGEGDIFSGVLLTNLADTIMQIDDSNMAMMFIPSLKTLFGDIDGIAQSVTVAPNEEVLFDSTYTILMNDGRDGLMSLFGENTVQSPTPVFVGEDTLIYAQGILEFNKLAPVLRETIMGQPMLAMQVGPQMEMIEASLVSFLAPLGTTYHLISTGTMPFDRDTVGTLFAIECNDEEAFTGTLSMMLPAMGAEPTDFLGNQIYTIDLGANIPMPMPVAMEYSVAVGGGYVFVGTQRNVENALRAIANPKESRGTASANSAVGLLDITDVSSWSYGDMGKSLEVQVASQAAMTEGMFKEMESFDPAMAEEMRNEFADANAMGDAVTGIITSLFGPMTSVLTTDDQGMTSRLIMLTSEK